MDALNSGNAAYGASYYQDPNNEGIPDPNVAYSGGPQAPATPAGGVDQGGQSGNYVAPPPTIPVPTTPPTPVQANQPNPGGLTASPTQVTAANINNLQSQQELTGRQGATQGQGFDAAAKIQHDAALEKEQHALDYSKLLQAHADESAQDHSRIVSAYNAHRAAAEASGKDPTNEFWGDHGGFAGRLLGALGAFSSGFGAGLLGKGGNPFLDHINEEINKNFQSHQAHIKDLYNTAVEAGDVGKSDQERQQFEQKAKLQYYDLASQNIQHKLDEVSNTTQSTAVRQTAEKAKLDLENQITAQRSNLFQQQAQQAAAGLAMQRKMDGEVRSAYQTALEKHGANLSEADARIEAAKDVEAQFGGQPLYKNSVSRISSQVGATYNPKTGKNEFPATLAGSPSQVTEEGVPLNDELGHRRTPDQINKDKELVVELPDGTKGIARSSDDKKKAEIMANSTQKIDQFYDLAMGSNGRPGLIDKIANGAASQEEIGQYNSARGAAVSSMKGAESGSSGITGIGQMRILAPEQFPELPMGSNPSILTGGGAVGTVLGGITGWAGEAKGKMKGLSEFSNENKKAISTYIRPTATTTATTGGSNNIRTVPLGTKPQ